MPLFLFDIDGTLLRGATAVHRDAFAAAFREVYGVDASLDGVPAAGRTDSWLLVEALRRHDVPEAVIEDRMARAFRVMETYVEEHLGDLRAMVLLGVPDLLARLSDDGLLLGLLTGNLSRIAAAKMRHAGLAPYFRLGAYGEESVVRGDLVPVALAKASDAAGRTVLPGEAILIGDTPLDVEAGKAHGTKTVGVATGPHSVSELRESGPDLVLSSLAGAEEALSRLVGKPPMRRSES